MIEQVIRNFAEQFTFDPEITNEGSLEKNSYVIAGMGGSHLAGDLIQAWNPKINIVVSSDYGLESIPDEVLQNSLIIASSYSGNTEEAISVFNEAVQKNVSSVRPGDGRPPSDDLSLSFFTLYVFRKI